MKRKTYNLEFKQEAVKYIKEKQLEEGNLPLLVA